MVASSLTTLEPVLLSDFEGPEDLARCLEASAAVPNIAGEQYLGRYCRGQHAAPPEHQDALEVPGPE